MPFPTPTGLADGCRRFHELIQELSSEFETLRTRNEELIGEVLRLREVAAKQNLNDTWELPALTPAGNHRQVDGSGPTDAVRVQLAARHLSPRRRALEVVHLSPSTRAPMKAVLMPCKTVPQDFAVDQTGGNASPRNDIVNALPIGNGLRLSEEIAVLGDLHRCEESSPPNGHRKSEEASLPNGQRKILLTKDDMVAVRSSDCSCLTPTPCGPISEDETACPSKELVASHSLDNRQGTRMLRSPSMEELMAGNPTTDSKYKMLNQQNCEMVILETIPAFVILLNALTMAFSSDIERNNPCWDIFEGGFLTFYAVEFLIKIHVQGCHAYFCGKEYKWNWFDFVCLDLSAFDLILTYILNSSMGRNKSYKLLKIARVARLTRLVRVLKYRFFDELRAMVLGVVSGLRVLAWAIILLFYCIFTIGVFMRNLYGDERNFRSVAHAMFTVFRCYTDGCTDELGRPLQARMFDKYGGVFMIGYILSFMFITVGVFNLIMAIFIDNVVSSSVARKLQFIGDHSEEMELKIKHVLASFIRRHEEELTPTEFENRTSLMAGEEKGKIVITRELFTDWLSHPEMRNLLEDVHVDIATRADLFDVLDVDMGGELEIAELVHGLMSLRGPITKSDIVAVRLKVSYMTKMVEELWQKVVENRLSGDSTRSSLQVSDKASSTGSTSFIEAAASQAYRRQSQTLGAQQSTARSARSSNGVMVSTQSSAYQPPNTRFSMRIGALTSISSHSQNPNKAQSKRQTTQWVRV